MTTSPSQPTEIKLVFDEPKQRVKPPLHFADLSPEERKAKAVELGIPAYGQRLTGSPGSPPTSMTTQILGRIFLKIFDKHWPLLSLQN